MTEALNQNSILYNVDDIVTDLNNKADKDLLNINSSIIQFSGKWVGSNYTIASGVNLPDNTSGDLTYDLSSYLPNDGYQYGILFYGQVTTGSTSGNYSGLYLISSISGNTCVCRGQTRAASSVTVAGNAIYFVGADRKIGIYHLNNNTGTFSLYARGYFRLSNNL